MDKYKYDLHIHTCLSPCGDNDMTPNNIVNMSIIKNRQLIAVCDHNTCGNAGAVIKAAPPELTVVPGMELTTSEDIHILLYFPSVDSAEAFERETVDPKRMLIKNRPEIFGEQLCMNELDEIIGSREYLLINAVNISINEVPDIIAPYGAICIPAHIDKEANGMLSILGWFPQDIDFYGIEIKETTKKKEFEAYGKRIFTNSDAHFLWDISENDDVIEWQFQNKK